MKEITYVLGFLIILWAFSIHNAQTGYQSGFNEGYSRGQSEGYNEGKDYLDNSTCAYLIKH